MKIEYIPATGIFYIYMPHQVVNGEAATRSADTAHGALQIAAAYAEALVCGVEMDAHTASLFLQERGFKDEG